MSDQEVEAGVERGHSVTGVAVVAEEMCVV